MNVFTSHNDIETKKNKFDFDKIIIVCDLENIENIFHHLYGQNTDWVGYIDKFYSVEPFHFSNLDAIKVYLLKQFKISVPEQTLIIVAHILNLLVDKGKITLRQILKSDHFEIPHEYTIYSTKVGNSRYSHIRANLNLNQIEIYMTNQDVPLLFLFRILKLVVGDYEKVIKIIQETTNYHDAIPGEYMENFIKQLIIPQRLRNGFETQTVFTEDNNTYTYPFGQIYVYKYKINIKWNASNPYKGEESYFKDCNIYLTPSNNMNSALDSTFGKYLRHILDFFNFCKKNNFLPE